MISLTVAVLFWTSAVLASHTHPPPSDEYLVSSPVIRRLLERVDVLETRGAKQADEIETLKTEMAQQRGDMVKMRTMLRARDNTIRSLLHRLTASNDDRNVNVDNASDLQKTSLSKGTVTQKRSEAKQIRQVDIEVQVAFSAGLTTSLLNVGDDQPIKFDHVITNVGNAYNPHFGSFVAPVSGIYVFSTSILSYDSPNNWVYTQPL